jgi:hypothetical protein
LVRRHRSLGEILSYDGLPATLKRECLVRSKVDEDQEELKARQELVNSMNPAELSKMHGISDFPLPRQIDSLVRPSRRQLKSTKDKELQKRRYSLCLQLTLIYVGIDIPFISKSWSSLPDSVSKFGTLKSLNRECLVRTREENPEVQRERQEVLKNKSVSELAQIASLSDVPIPATLERMFANKKKAKSGPSSR